MLIQMLISTADQVLQSTLFSNEYQSCLGFVTGLIRLGINHFEKGLFFHLVLDVKHVDDLVPANENPAVLNHSDPQTFRTVRNAAARVLS